MHWHQVADKVVKVNQSAVTKEQFKATLKYENIASKYMYSGYVTGYYTDYDIDQYNDYLLGKIKYTYKGTSHEEVNN